ncbi:hypothetical protein LTR17_002178 [Elasticomyces elasticus]|nr:hypothetical protein LTR17_002178 [Elasticomyces elasticus]
MAHINDTLAVIATTSVGMAQPPTLLTIAPELRNTIYELVFTADAGPVKLLEASPPEKALLQVCRQTLDEAAGLYVAAFRSYWRGTTFTIRRTDEVVTTACRVNFDMEDIKQIGSLLSTADSGMRYFPVLQSALSRLWLSAERDSVCTFRHLENASWRLVTIDGNAVDTSNGVLVELENGHGQSYYAPRSKAIEGFPAKRKLTLQQLQVILGRTLLLKGEETTTSDGQSEV